MFPRLQTWPVNSKMGARADGTAAEVRDILTANTTFRNRARLSTPGNLADAWTTVCASPGCPFGTLLHRGATAISMLPPLPPLPVSWSARTIVQEVRGAT